MRAAGRPPLAHLRGAGRAGCCIGIRGQRGNAPTPGGFGITFWTLPPASVPARGTMGNGGNHRLTAPRSGRQTTAGGVWGRHLDRAAGSGCGITRPPTNGSRSRRHRRVLGVHDPATSCRACRDSAGRAGSRRRGPATSCRACPGESGCGAETTSDGAGLVLLGWGVRAVIVAHGRRRCLLHLGLHLLASGLQRGPGSRSLPASTAAAGGAGRSCSSPTSATAACSAEQRRERLPPRFDPAAAAR